MAVKHARQMILLLLLISFLVVLYQGYETSQSLLVPNPSNHRNSLLNEFHSLAREFSERKNHSLNDTRLQQMSPLFPGGGSQTKFNNGHESNSSNIPDIIQQTSNRESIVKQTNHQSPLERLGVPRPIFVTSLPKSGTTTVHRYFVCGKVWSAHTFCNTHDHRQIKIGQCVSENIDRQQAPFQGCGNYHVWSDAGWLGHKCFYPSIHGQALQAMVDAYKPNMTLLSVRRNATKWVASLRKWKNGSLLNKWKKCPQFPSYEHSNPPNISDAEWEAFYHWHGESIRSFAKDHGVAYLEIDLDAMSMDEIGEYLHLHTGINSTACLKHHNSHEKRLRLNPKFRKQAQKAGLLDTNNNTEKKLVS